MPRTAPAKKAPAKKAASKKPAQDELPDETDSWFVGLDETEDYINAVFYGREGSAKTTDLAFMANLPGDGKVLVINAEGGLKKGPLLKRGVDTSKLVVWPDPKSKERITRDGLLEVFLRMQADLSRDPDSWKGIAWDSITEIHTALLDGVQGKRVEILARKGAEPDEDFVDIADYGVMTKQIRDLLRKFRDLPCHFVVTALERRDIDKDTGKPQYGPAVTPGLQGDLLGYVDMVLMCKAEDEDGPFRALTRANSRYRAKDRFDVLPRVMAYPTFDRMVAYLSGELTEDNDPLQKELPVKAKKAQDKSSKDDDTEDAEADDDD